MHSRGQPLQRFFPFVFLSALTDFPTCVLTWGPTQASNLKTSNWNFVRAILYALSLAVSTC